MKKYLSAAAWAALFFMIGFFNRYHLPKIKSWILVEIEEQSRQNLPLRIWPTDIGFTLFPLGLELTDVRLLPEGELEKTISPTQVGRVGISINIFDLARGRVAISSIQIESAELHVFFSKRKNNKKFELDLDRFFAIPIDEIDISKVDFYWQLKEQALNGFVKDLSLNIKNQYKSFAINFDSEKIYLKQQHKDPTLNFNLQSKILLDQKKIHFSSFKLEKGKSFLVSAGTLKGDIEKLKIEETNIKTRSHLTLSELRRFVLEVSPATKLPKMSGWVELDVESAIQTQKDPEVQFSINTKDVEVEGFSVGQLEAEGQYKNKIVSIEKLSSKHRGGFFELDKTKISIDKKTSFSTNLLSRNVHLGKLLDGLKVKGVPVESSLNAKIPCQGEIHPQLKVDCEGQVVVDHVDVSASTQPNSFRIVNFKNGVIKGKTTITNKSVTYAADLKIGENTQGRSTGVIDFKKGFDIRYNSPNFSLSDLSNLAQLDVSGDLSIRGNTKGTSKYATINMQTKGKSLELEKFKLGNNEFEFRYKKSLLSFRDIQGSFNASKYRGDFSINLKKDRLFLNMTAPFIDAEDLTKAIDQKYPLPFSLTGTGTAKITLRGPLKVDRLSYQLESSLYRGLLAGESFDQILFNAEAQDGNLKTQEAVITKGSSRVEINGELKRDGQIRANILGKRLRIEQSENLSRLKLRVGGQLDFWIGLKGSREAPKLNANGTLTRMTVGNSPAKDSKFKLEMDNQSLLGESSLAGGDVEANFLVPLKKKKPFKLSLKSKQWDFTHLFSLFTGNPNQTAFKTNLTGIIELESRTGEFKDLAGSIGIESFLVQKGPVSMKSVGPMSLVLADEKVIARDFSLKGDNTFFEVKTPEKPQKLDVDINGKVDMALLTLLLPFLDDLNGDLAVSVNVGGQLTKPKLIGSAFVQKGIAKIRNFPHPIESITADILFSQQSLLVNSLKGSIGNGSLAAGGSVEFKGLKNVPIALVGQLSNVTLQIPEGFKTRGSGDFSLKGSWFPYVIRADYEVKDGKVNRNLSGVGADTKQIQPSTFLPRFMVRDSFDPIVLNARVRIPNEIPVVMKIANIEVETPISGELKILGAPTSPILNGKLNTGKEGKVTFRTNVFEVQTGQVTYNNDPPENPSLLVKAESRVPTNNLDYYDVTLLLQGQVPNPKINLTSQPPLPENKLISLLALGVITGSDDISSGDSTGEDIELGTGFLAEQFGLGPVLRKRFGVQIDVTSRINAEENEETAHTVTIKKQWTPKFGAAASRTFGRENKNALKVEYKLNRGLSVVGNWKQEETEEASSDTESEFGLDLEYKLEFK